MENSTVIQSNGISQPTVLEVNRGPTIAEFVSAVGEGVKAWERAGAMLVRMLELDRTVFKKIMEAYPFITHDTLEVFHSIGLKTLHPLTMMLPRTVLPFVRQMRYEAQETVTKGLIKVVARMAGDKPVIVEKPVARLSAEEARRALWPKGNRSVEWQVRSLTNRLEKAMEPKAPVKTAKEMERKPIGRGKFVIRRGVGGAWILEKTMATPYNLQRVFVEQGQATIELCEWGGPKQAEPEIIQSEKL